MITWFPSVMVKWEFGEKVAKKITWIAYLLTGKKSLVIEKSVLVLRIRTKSHQSVLLYRMFVHRFIRNLINKFSTSWEHCDILGHGGECDEVSEEEAATGIACVKDPALSMCFTSIYQLESCSPRATNTWYLATLGMFFCLRGEFMVLLQF